jgi:hypothetical protein
MTRLRRFLVPVTAVWLFFQAGTVAFVPAALWITAADPRASECTCGHGVGMACPMHHTAETDADTCAMQAANNFAAAILTTLTGTTGLITEPARSIRPQATTEFPRTADANVAGERPVPPDPPPPRA